MSPARPVALPSYEVLTSDEPPTGPPAREPEPDPITVEGPTISAGESWEWTIEPVALPSYEVLTEA